MITKLYSSSDLLKGYDRNEAVSFTETTDYRLYRRYVAEGRGQPKMEKAAIAQAGHDVEIGRALAAFLKSDDKIVAIMGGHSLSRGCAAYNLIAGIARNLTLDKFLIVTGGGPGAMEAAHVGAYFAPAAPDVFEKALAVLSDKTTASLPKGLDSIVATDGTINPDPNGIIPAAANWLNTALKARDLWEQGKSGRSLAVPTWLYGSEPTTPFATAYAKYFQNSIREESLVAEGKVGTLYAQGEGGTLREIYQGVEQNYYVRSDKDFKPMIFVDPDRYWERDAEYNADGSLKFSAIKIDDSLRAIFKLNASVPTAVLADRLRFTTDFDTVHDVLKRYSAIVSNKLPLLLMARLTSA